MDKSKKCPTGNPPSISKECNVNDISVVGQRQRLLKYLKQKSINTLEARLLLNVMSPASRIFELRRQGHNIQTFWIKVADSQGHSHRIGKYVLLHRRKEDKL